MSDSEAFSMTEANYCALLLDRLLHGKQQSLQRNNGCRWTNDSALFEIEAKFNDEQNKNEFDCIFNKLKFCITTTNRGICVYFYHCKNKAK